MTGLLIANSIALVVVTATATVFLVKWFKAEKKLAKHGESKIYIKEKKNERNNDLR